MLSRLQPLDFGCAMAKVDYLPQTLFKRTVKFNFYLRAQTLNNFGLVDFLAALEDKNPLENDVL